VLALGDRDGRAWRVGVDDGEGGVLGGVALSDGEALMSSGRYAKFRPSPEGERWPHVLNPASGRPATGARLSAVLHADPVLADAAATALLVAGPEGFEAVVLGMKLGCALMMDEAGRLWITQAMDARFETTRPFERAGHVDTGSACVMP
jgi:thiamine biosynthesis lipoprotein